MMFEDEAQRKKYIQEAVAKRLREIEEEITKKAAKIPTRAEVAARKKEVPKIGCVGHDCDVCQGKSRIKDHEIAETVNTLRDIALEFRDAQQLRARIADVLVPLLKKGTPL